jgi:hypothetical protein
MPPADSGAISAKSRIAPVDLAPAAPQLLGAAISVQQLRDDHLVRILAEAGQNSAGVDAHPGADLVALTQARVLDLSIRLQAFKTELESFCIARRPVRNRANGSN